MKALVLAAWDAFEAAGLSGLGLDVSCGAVLAVAVLAAVPVLGRLVGALSDLALDGLGRVFGGRSAHWTANYLTFPGVVLHELCHALAAKLSGAKVESVRLFDPDGETLGRVEFTCRGRRKRDIAFQRAVSSCAPVIGGLLIIPLFRAAAAWGSDSPALCLLAWHGAVSMACHMDMSRQDMRNYLKGCAWLLPYAVAACTVAAYVIGHNR